MPGWTVSIIVSQENQFGLRQDAELLRDFLQKAGRLAEVPIGTIRILDPRQPPVISDVAIHLEVPHPVWFPWSVTNVLMVNGEWYYPAWNGHQHGFDAYIVKDTATRDSLAKELGSDEKVHIVPWCLNGSSPPFTVKPDAKREFVWFLGGSINKRSAAQYVWRGWEESYPPLTIYSTKKLGLKDEANKHIVVGYLDRKEQLRIASETLGHLGFSHAESYGVAIAEAVHSGAFVVLNDLPVFQELYKDTPNVRFVKGAIDTERPEKPVGHFQRLWGENLDDRLPAILAEFANWSPAAYPPPPPIAASQAAFLEGLGKVLRELSHAAQIRGPLPRHMPPILNIEDCPPISVITLVHNRPKFIQNCFLNLLSTDYPKEKIEWIVIDDSDADKSPSNEVLGFQAKFGGKINYIPVIGNRTIGYKRNLGCKRATADVILMMDDDDHYPSTSFRRRVAYLLKGRTRPGAAVCTAIAMYNLQNGTSAVNVPPYGLSLAQRCSEATLTFLRSFWETKKFGDTNQSEGESFLEGRENQVVEIPPQQIIVALSHGSNISGRTFKTDNQAGKGCFWGFPRQLLEFLHGLIGVTVEAE